MATSLSSVPAVTRHVGERRGSLFRESAGNKAQERGGGGVGGGGGALSATLNMKKAYTKDQRDMHDHIADGVFGKLQCRLLFFPPILLSLDCFTFLSHKSPDVLSPG